MENYFDVCKIYGVKIIGGTYHSHKKCANVFYTTSSLNYLHNCRRYKKKKDKILDIKKKKRDLNTCHTHIREKYSRLQIKFSFSFAHSYSSNSKP